MQQSYNRVMTHNVMVAILVYQSNETAAMLACVAVFSVSFQASGSRARTRGQRWQKIFAFAPCVRATSPEKTATQATAVLVSLNQSCGSSFLRKHFLLFQYVWLATSHVSKNALYSSGTFVNQVQARVLEKSANENENPYLINRPVRMLQFKPRWRLILVVLCWQSLQADSASKGDSLWRRATSGNSNNTSL